MSLKDLLNILEKCLHITLVVKVSMERPSFWKFRDVGMQNVQQPSKLVQYGRHNKGQTKVS